MTVESILRQTDYQLGFHIESLNPSIKTEIITLYSNENIFETIDCSSFNCNLNTNIPEGSFRIEISVFSRAFYYLIVLIYSREIYRDILVINDNIAITGEFLISNPIQIRYPEKIFYTHMFNYLFKTSFIGKEVQFDTTGGPEVTIGRRDGNLLINSTENVHKNITIGYSSSGVSEYIDYGLYTTKCPEYTIHFSLIIGDLSAYGNISIIHSGYTLIKDSSLYFPVAYCSPFKDFKVIFKIYNNRKWTYQGKLYFNEFINYFIKGVNSLSDDVFLNETSFDEVNFKYKMEYSDVEQGDNDWREYFEGNKWPSYYLGEFPQTTQRNSYYRIIYTNFLPLLDLVEYNIKGSANGIIELFFNGIELENEGFEKQFIFTANQTIIRDGNNYIAFTVERNETSDSDDLYFEVTPVADENNCADSACSRKFCQNSTEFLNAEVNNFYTTKCGFGRNGYKKFNCVEEEGDRIYKLEEHCEKLAEDFEYGNNN